MWSRKFGKKLEYFQNFKKQIYNFQRIIYHTKNKWKESYWTITCKTYVGFDEI